MTKRDKKQLDEMLTEIVGSLDRAEAHLQAIQRAGRTLKVILKALNRRAKAIT